MLPVSETKTVVIWSAAEVNNEGHDEEPNDGQDLDTSEDEFGFSVYCHGEDIEADDNDDDDRYPDRYANALSTFPILTTNQCLLSCSA